MEKIRLLHFADLHIGVENYGRLDPTTGVNRRVLDFLRRFDKLIDYGLEREVDLVTFAFSDALSYSILRIIRSMNPVSAGTA